MNDIKKAIETISDIYKDYLFNENDIVNLKPYDEALLEVHTVLEQTLQEKAERDKMRCENCKHIRSNDNFRWCGCTAGLDGNRKPADFCSYFEPKESEGK